ncbi:MAG: peroxiredoxin [Novosphingobium meiothermophilum]|uniref:peroxiredoxin n=1 Tax=Novosphingobium TaxID=165696 RepID=UPI000D6E4DDB|nr:MULTISPECIES: peroxiredoxin [Novosphingobium]
MTRTASLLAAAALALGIAAPASAELAAGAKAPVFVAKGALAGKPFTFSLADALKKGPVVLYFYPKAFTQGCTLEAHAFAEASADFAAAGATVIGMSNDDIATLQKFSTEACRDKFAVAAASPEVIKGYDVALKAVGIPIGLTKRTSYVIGTDGRIVMVHSDMDYRDHVKLTLAAVRKLKPAR